MSLFETAAGTFVIDQLQRRLKGFKTTLKRFQITQAAAKRLKMTQETQNDSKDSK